MLIQIWKMKKLLVLLCLFTGTILHGQESRPKLVIGIVVDQMRQDYLYRYASRFSDSGFLRLVNNGFMAKNMHYNYIPTYTGPGHAAIYTGTTPKYNGIVGNNWYSRKEGKQVYCAFDNSSTTVGNAGNAGKMSPHRLKSSTITDELKLATNFSSKVVGISIKDRGAIFPAGHTPNGAYWYDKSTGKLITSSYYQAELPKWVRDYNAKNKADAWLNQTWNTLYPIETYTASEDDDQEYEFKFREKKDSSFPYDLKKYRNINGNFGMLATTPFGNTWVVDAGLSAIEGEELGQDSITDFLALSFSSTDYIGHAFGPRSIETEDTYLRLDREISRLLAYLDEKIGEGEYLVFLTADHGAADNPGFARKHHLQGGEFHYKAIKSELDSALNIRFGEGDWVLYLDNDQVYLNHTLIDQSELRRETVANFVVEFFLEQPGIANAVSASDLRLHHKIDYIEKAMEQGFNVKRSGDVLLMLNPGYMNKRKVGTTHGTGYAYDTHVPFLLYGKSVPKGTSVKRYAITDIAPTLSVLLNIGFPSSTTGNAIEDVFFNTKKEGY